MLQYLSKIFDEVKELKTTRQGLISVSDQFFKLFREVRNCEIESEFPVDS